MKRRVAITGLGVCSPVGSGIERMWSALVEGRSGISEIRRFDASQLRSRVAGEVDDVDPVATLPRKLYRSTTRFTHLALLAAEEALEVAGIESGEAREEIAVVFGSGIGGFDRLEAEHQVFLSRGPGKIAPRTVPLIIANMAAGTIASHTGCRGPNLCLSTACATGTHSIGTALDLIRSGRTEVAIAGASESTLSPFAIEGYCQLRALSTRNDDPEAASRPFDRDRDGFVIAEGAGAVVLEEYEHAQRRGATVYAELAGYGATADGHHATAPDPEGRGAARALRAALSDAQLNPTDIDVVNAHGTSTPLNDPIETRVIREVLGTHVDRTFVHSTKSMTGHSLGASGAIEAVVAALTIDRGVVHPTINLETPDPACDLDYVAGSARDRDVGAIVSHSFAFGGHNAVLAFAKPDR